ncbi:MAG: hypothetical protein RLZZ450_2726 [Pseudomonadota bacterium]
MLTEGELVGQRYRVLELLGRGGMGMVYAALDRELDRAVALKVLPRERCGDPVAVERFLRQAKALARIAHRGVVRVYDRGLHEGELPYVVMERLEGRDLSRALREGERFSPARALALTAELCDVVEAVHRHGLVHRDLTPANVFLVEDDSEQRVRLLDFGLARIADEAPLTVRGDVFGTLAYMAPELLISAEHASARSDVYAVSCILYELLVGEPPFRARNRAELRAAIRHDVPAPFDTLLTKLVPGVEALVLQNLAKEPSGRLPSASTFATALRRLAPVEDRKVFSSSLVPPTVLDRFELVGRLGQGSAGIVHEAVDRTSGQRVALKQLRVAGPDSLLRFKREFRTLAALSHPNVIRLHELWVEDEVAFFSMDLIEGRDLLTTVREDPERTRALFVQLATGLSALHSRRLVHRDLKPTNVLVDARGRAVLIDFGLTVHHLQQSVIAGTPGYMAPETLAGTLGPEADMFALGAMLHEALTGELPSSALLEPALSDESTPLWELSAALLSPEPARRPDVEQVIAWLGAGSRDDLDSSSGVATTQFVGRRDELAVLERALHSIRADHPSVWLVRGQSGLGKSALLARVERAFGPSALCLASGCRDSEAIPYPALDGALDALSEHLTRLPREQRQALMDADSYALGELFPVMRRHLPTGQATECAPLDPIARRTLGHAALRRLLCRLGEQRPVVLIVDDMQWLDPDSGALLSCLLTGPERPRLLVLGALRSDVTPGATLRGLLDTLPEPASQLELSELSTAEAHALVVSLWRHGTPSESLARRLVAQASGHPLFLTALVGGSDARVGQPWPSLEQTILARVEALSVPARQLLHHACVAERPVPLTRLCEAAGVPMHQAREARHVLAEARLAMRIESAGSLGIEPYHRRVREVVLAALSASERRACHRALAAALADEPEHLEARIEHLAGSGDGAEAARLAVSAAHAAAELCAFERAAALYEVALAHGRVDDDERARWLVLQAALFRRAGRGVDAARALLRAAATMDDEDGHRLQREAGELLVLSGEVEEGLTLLAPMLLRTALSVPETLAQAHAQALSTHALLAHRGLVPNERSANEDSGEREQLELCLTLANGLAMIDLRGVPFALRALYLALELGDPEPLQRAAACFVRVTAGLFHNDLIEPVLTLCRALTAQLGTAYARALCQTAEGEAAHFTGRFSHAEAAFEQAERILLESCVDATRELAAVRNGAVLIEYAQKGDFRSQLTRTLRWQADAEARHDVFHASVLRLAHAIVWIAQDQPDKARAELAARRWQRRGSPYEIGMLLFADVADRYEGDDDAHLHPLQGDQELLTSPAVATPFLSGYIHLQRAWGCIRALAAGRHSRGERALVHTSIAALRALGPAIWQAVADAYEANLLYLAGDREAALSLLDGAERTFRSLHMRCLGACARRRHGELAGGEFGARLIVEASRELAQLGVARPERWARAYFSLFDPALGNGLTLSSEA